MKTKVEERFSEFFEKWMCQLHEYLQHLRRASEDYRAKTGCEQNAYSWVTGWKPSAVLKLVNSIRINGILSSSLVELTQEHMRKIEALRVKIRDYRAKTGCECEQELQALVSKVIQHYKDYYTIKWALAHEDVLAFFCPTWISPLENAYSWVTGLKPSAVFKLVNSIRTNGVPSSSLVELTQEHMRKIEALRVKIMLEEEKVEREMERQQVIVADRKMAELVRLLIRVKNGEEVRQVEGLVEVALKGVMAGLKKVMKAVDCVRLRILKGVLDVLSPLQCVQFLAGIGMLQILLRQWGKKRVCTIN
ncbi:hypothetical protein GH714_014287 [Hevea brasiliensis]|uniref:DOG1 domain-containing protein n=1 Tax=Hevea brasiliensis TaxID=3981 RepID=A0A6A6LSD3_HEVBR|nr:hypothetical protein GH714_014287 [Hevea brasiliensis]